LVIRSIIVFIWCSIVTAQSIQISVDKNILQDGELLKLSIQVVDGEDFAKVDLGPLESDFDIISGPSQQNNIQWINGSVSSTKTLSWTLLPKRSGNLSIPVLSGTVGSKTFKGKKIPIQIGKLNNDRINEVFIVAEIDKKDAFLGEQVTLTYKLYKRIDMNIAGIDQFQMPDFKGFWTEELYTPQRFQYQSKEVTVKGLRYQVANLGQRALFPIASDKHEIPPVKIKVQLEVKKKKRRRDPFFDSFFDSFLSETKTIVLTTDVRDIKIKPYPDSRPYDFTGAVGEFELFSEIDRDNVKANEGITFSVILKGTGNIGLFSLPEIKFPKNVEVFPPIENFEKDGFRNQITGNQKWEYILIPREEGKLVLPRVQMSFFEPNSKSWIRANTVSHEISVSPNDLNTIRDQGLTKREVELIGQDIRYIHTGNYELKSKENQNLFFYLITYMLTSFIYSLPLLISKITGYRLSTEADRKIHNALRVNLKKLKRNTFDDPFEKASRIFYIYLKDRLALRSDKLDPAKVRSILINKIDMDLFDELIDILTICDQGRYSPDAIDKKDTIIDEMAVLLNRIEKALQ